MTRRPPWRPTRSLCAQLASQGLGQRVVGHLLIRIAPALGPGRNHWLTSRARASSSVWRTDKPPGTPSRRSVTSADGSRAEGSGAPRSGVPQPQAEDFLRLQQPHGVGDSRLAHSLRQLFWVRPKVSCSPGRREPPQPVEVLALEVLTRATSIAPVRPPGALWPAGAPANQQGCPPAAPRRPSVGLRPHSGSGATEFAGRHVA